MVQWLRLRASAAGRTGLIPGQGGTIVHALWEGKEGRKVGSEGRKEGGKERKDIFHII